MLSNLTGWHILIILGMLVILATVAVIVIVIAIRLSRNKARSPVAIPPDPVLQIKRLAELRDEGLLSEAEYEAKRAELLGRI